jgi:cytochrome c nitrite reductase small subunit
MSNPSPPTRTVKRLGLGGLLLGVFGGTFIGAGAYTFYYAEGTSYLSEDPKACVNCHVMRDQYDGWQKGSHHAAATCNDCHVPHDLVGKYLAKMDHGYRHSKAFTLQNFHEPIRITQADLVIVQNNCRRCHSELVQGIDEIGHAAGTTDCVRCHAGVGHGPVK